MVIQKQYYIWAFDAENYPLGIRYVFAPYDIFRFNDSTYYMHLN